MFISIALETGKPTNEKSLLIAYTITYVILLV